MAEKKERKSSWEWYAVKLLFESIGKAIVHNAVNS
jgi:hypothetical protein